MNVPHRGKDRQHGINALFVFPRAETSYRPISTPLGLLSIASYLNANGHRASICTDVTSPKRIREEIHRFQPDIIGVSVIAVSFIKNAISVSKAAKREGKTVVWGGTMATSIPNIVLESGLADYVSLLEGEETWLEMANALDNDESFDEIRGLAYLKHGKYHQTETQ